MQISKFLKCSIWTKNTFKKEKTVFSNLSFLVRSKKPWTLYWRINKWFVKKSTQPFTVNERDDAEEFVWEKWRRTDLNTKLAINWVFWIGDRMMMWNEHFVFPFHGLDSIRQPIHSVLNFIFLVQCFMKGSSCRKLFSHHQ